MNPVTEFTILTTDTLLFRKEFPAVETWSANDFYQLLYDGRKAKLVKHIHADLKNNTDPMQTNYGRDRFQKREDYYVWVANEQPSSENYFLKLSDGQMKSVVASKKSLVGAWPQKADRIDQYLTDHKLKVKSWTEFMETLRYADAH